MSSVFIFYSILSVFQILAPAIHPILSGFVNSVCISWVRRKLNTDSGAFPCWNGRSREVKVRRSLIFDRVRSSYIYISIIRWLVTATLYWAKSPDLQHSLVLPVWSLVFLGHRWDNTLLQDGKWEVYLCPHDYAAIAPWRLTVPGKRIDLDKIYALTLP